MYCEKMQARLLGQNHRTFIPGSQGIASPILLIFLFPQTSSTRLESGEPQMDAVHAVSSYHCQRTMSLENPNLLFLLEEDVIFILYR